MPVQSKLLDLLVCPQCLGALYVKSFGSREELCCPLDRLAFRVEGGIPVMLLDEARALTQEEVDSCRKS